MKKLKNIWKDGLAYLRGDELISFYTFFTIIFAECAFLRIFYEGSIIIPFTIIFIGYIVNITLCAWLKGLCEGTKLEVLFAVLYIIAFILLFVIGCFINIKISIIMTVIPFIVTAICLALIYSRFGRLIAIVVPFIVFTVSIVMLPALPMILKVIIPIVYAFCIPFISYMEDASSALNIFELAFDITWSKELEEFRKTISKY